MLQAKICQKWDLNPRPQSGLRPERSALDHSAILTKKLPEFIYLNFQPSKILLSSFKQSVVDVSKNGSKKHY